MNTQGPSARSNHRVRQPGRAARIVGVLGFGVLFAVLLSAFTFAGIFFGFELAGERSPDLPVSTIEMKRIQARHMNAIFSIEGVHSFGIGPYGFVVEILPGTSEEQQARVPTSLEGVPVTVEEQPMLTVMPSRSERRQR